MANTYSVGTVAVTNGSKTVTITGGLFISINVKPGDQIGIAGGLLNAIDTLTDATHAVLVRPWEGATGTGLTYIVWHMPAGWGDRVELNEAVAENIRLLGEGIPFTAEQLEAANAAAADAEASMISASQSEAYAEIAANTATVKADEIVDAYDIVIPARDLTVAAKDQALLARDAALASGTTYPDIATGRAAVADNAYFKVIGSGNVAYRLYRRLTSATQQLVFEQPNTRAVEEIEVASGLRGRQPNLFSNRSLNFEADPFLAHTNPLVADRLNGLPCWKSTTKLALSSLLILQKPASDFPSGLVSAAITVLGLSASQSGATSTTARFMLTQRAAGGAEISGTRFEFTLVTPTTAALAAPLAPIRAAGIVLHPDCVDVNWRIQFDNTGASIDRTIWFRDMLLCDGPTATYRTGPGLTAGDLAPLSATLAGVDNESAVSPAGVRAAQVDRAGSEWSANDFPDPTLIRSGASLPWNPTLPIVNKHGRRCVVTPSSVSAVLVRSPTIDVSNYASGRISASVVIEEKPDHTTAANLRLRLEAFDANGTALIWPDVSTSDLPTVNLSYGRNIPAAAITGPTTIVIGEGILLPANTATVCFNIRVATAVQAYITKFTIREGMIATYKDAPALSEIGPTAAASATAIGLEDGRNAIGLKGGVIDLSVSGKNYVLNPNNFAPVVHSSLLSAGQRSRIDVSVMRTSDAYGFFNHGTVSASAGTSAILEIDCGAERHFRGEGIAPGDTSTTVIKVFPGEHVRLTRITTTRIHVSRSVEPSAWITQPNYRYRRCADGTIEAIYTRSTTLGAGAEASDNNFPPTFNMAAALCIGVSLGALADGSAPPSLPPQVTKKGVANALNPYQFAVRNPNVADILHPIHCHFIGITETA